jgi:hypothetical protein
LQSKEISDKTPLDRTPPEEAFYFYAGIGQFLGVSSDSLADFCDKIRSVDIRSIEFHVTRGDFEAWIRHLGDTGLERRLRLIREMGLTGEALRERLYAALRSRCDELERQQSIMRVEPYRNLLTRTQ